MTNAKTETTAPGAVPAETSKLRLASSGHFDAVTSAESNMAMTASSYMISGILFYGARGWLLSHWFGNQALCIAVGVLFGVAFSTCLVIIRLRQMPEPGQREIDALGGR